MPRQKKTDALSSAERSALSRKRRAARVVELPGDAITDADRIRERDGDSSRASAIVRVLREAAAHSGR